MSDNTLAFIPTRSSKINKKSIENFEAVSYSSYKSKKKKDSPSHKSTETMSDLKSFNIKQAKHEVIKFGMSGFDPLRKEEAKVQLAISLGAKPKKNKYKNYKQLLEEKKKEKETVKSLLNFQQLGKNHIGKSTAKGKGFDRKRRKPKNDLLDSYGEVKLNPKGAKS